MKTFDVVALGELLVDFTENGLSAQGNPLLEANPGGAPCNVLSMLQNLGKKTAFIGKVGADALGQMLIQAVRNQGINTDNLLVDDTVHTTLAFVHTDKDGDRSFSFYRNPGADMMLRWDEVHEDMLADTKIFHFGTLSMTDEHIEKVTKKAVEKAKSEDVLISFDPNLRPPLWKNLEDAGRHMWYGISQCDILKISDDEIAFLTGTDDIERGIEIILAKSHPTLVCATMGKTGVKRFTMEKVFFVSRFFGMIPLRQQGQGIHLWHVY